MIGIILLVCIFICISSIFYPELRKLALCLIATATVLVIGLVGLIEIASHH